MGASIRASGKPGAKAGKSPLRGVMADDRIARLELLVDELIKDRHEDEKIKACARAAGLSYLSDHVVLMERVLLELEGARENVGVDQNAGGTV